MKKALSLIALSLLLVLSAFAEECYQILFSVGEYDIVATDVEIIPAPRHTFKLYSKIGVADKNKSFIAQPVYDEISKPVEGRAKFKRDGKYGYFDENWNEIVPPLYNSAWDFSEGLALTTNENWLYGFIDKNGTEIIPHTLEYAEPFKDGLATVGKVDKGYNMNTFTRTGKWDKECRQIEPICYKWEDAYDVQMSANNVRINGKQYKNSDLAYPFINYLGYTYIPLTYHCTREMGFACDWSMEKGLVLRNTTEPHGSILGKNNMKPGKMFKANLYKGALTIGNETFFAGDVYYPILTCNDIVYIPVLWRQGMEGLGLEYSYDLETTSLVFERNN